MRPSPLALFSIASLLVACAGATPGPTAAPTATASTAPPPPPPPPPPPSPGPRPSFTVHVADVGTGLAVFVTGPDFSLVYDGGSNDDLATGDKNRFVAYLRAFAPRLARLDHVVVSHPHRDHVELLADVVLRYPPKNVWESGAVNDICGYRRFLGAVETTHASYHSGTTGDVDFGKPLCDDKLPPVVHLDRGAPATEASPIRLGDRATMTFLHVDPKVRGGSFNETSLVTLLDLDGTKVLLMGDAEAGGRADPSSPPADTSVEGYLLAHHRALLDADVLVVGHHGSKTSSRKAFIDAVTPKISVISSGPMKYGAVTLPDPEIVAELTATSTVFRTDVNDAECAKNEHKIGSDADGFAGGCDAVDVTVHAGTASGAYAHLSD